MEEVNYKSLLQEKLQSIKEKLPIYKTVKKENLFSSVVSFSVNDIKYLIEKEDKLFLTKKSSEKYIASVALEKIEIILNDTLEDDKINEIDKNEKKILISQIKNKICVLIDYESCNINREIDYLKNLTKNEENIEIIKICSDFSPLSKNADMTVPSSRKNATDVAICCIVSAKIVENNDIKIIVMTKDNFASCLTDIYNNICYHVPTVDKCIDKIIELKD